MGELHVNSLVHMKLPSSVIAFSCPTHRKISSHVVSLGSFINLQCNITSCTLNLLVKITV